LEEFNVTIVRAGHVVLKTSSCLDHLGHWVTLVDADNYTGHHLR
jgi:UDP-glucose 6-dehydrogenase